MSYPIEILFHSSSTPKPCKNVVAVYTKGGLLCVEYADRMIVKYPLCNVFSVAGKHQPHWGSGKEKK